MRASRRCLALDPRDDLVQRRGLVVLDVHAHLHEARARELEPERADAREPAVLLAYEPRNLARSLDAATEVDVERDQRPPGADEHAAGTFIQPRRAEVRRELARVDPALQLGRPARSEERGAAPVRELSVQENRQAELGTDPLGDLERHRPRPRHVRTLQCDDRNDVRGADARMGAFVPPEVDPLPRARDTGDKRLHQLVLAHEREDRAVVIGVGVNVEEARVLDERRGERVERLPVAALREVRHGLERKRHPRSVRTVKAYYEARAREYDDWYLGVGRFTERDRPGWEEELERLRETLASLPPARTLDVACGTGFLTRHLRGEITGLDQSATMLEVARERVPDGEFVEGDALVLPFEDDSFERVVTGHFYGHLEEPDRIRFLAEARRVAPELVVVDASQAHSPVAVEWQERILNDGSRWQVYKRFFTTDGLARELGGGEALLEGHWFVVVRSP